jgi:hypothetical protein
MSDPDDFESERIDDWWPLRDGLSVAEVSTFNGRISLSIEMRDEFANIWNGCDASLSREAAGRLIKELSRAIAHLDGNEVEWRAAREARTGAKP